ncbi:hypothetical protein OSB04_020428 [Centaurea solstitialis]|uniref:NTF2 domain-containing protein n=1 Tax=Centaurea solstitialis TaxID=347529 RepID=A0AA38T4C7_9ASTR|nr:hypothetical protein OSB04_020428 [Centaurea solstitialis]
MAAPAAAVAAAAVAAAPVSAQVDLAILRCIEKVNTIDEKKVGNAFVQQYYHILHQSPGLVHRFYQDVSKLGRPEEDGSMSITTTMDIRDAQESLNGGVDVLVTGYLTGKDNVLRNFTQSFFLAPQDKGFFVLNDIFRYMDIANHHEGDNAPTENVVTPVTPEQVPEAVPVPENDIPEQVAVLTEEPKAEEVVTLENGEEPTVEEEDPVPEVVDEVPEIPQLAVESNTKIETKEVICIHFNTWKQMRCCFLIYGEKWVDDAFGLFPSTLDSNGSEAEWVPFSSPAPAPKKPQPKNQEQHLNNAFTTNVAAEAVTSNADAVENGIHEEEAEGYSVYIKGLPMAATPAMLEEEFKKFGPIKPNGIQVRSNRVPDAVQKAIEASPVMFGTRGAVVEEKRSTNSKGGNRGRFVVGRGGSGFRNEGMRGRGNFGGGRGYNRVGDFGGNRNDYGYRGGSRGGAASNRGGGDGFHRDNNGGGRVNRGLEVNGSARNVAQ